MSSTADELPTLDFEIDHADVYAQFLLSNPREIRFYLNLLASGAASLQLYQ